MGDSEQAGAWRPYVPLAEPEKKWCGARTRCGGFCRIYPMKNGRCRLHGGLSTGAKTVEGHFRQVFSRVAHGFYVRGLLKCGFCSVRDYCEGVGVGGGGFCVFELRLFGRLFEEFGRSKHSHEEWVVYLASVQSLISAGRASMLKGVRGGWFDGSRMVDSAVRGFRELELTPLSRRVGEGVEVGADFLGLVKKFKEGKCVVREGGGK